MSGGKGGGEGRRGRGRGGGRPSVSSAMELREEGGSRRWEDGIKTWLNE